MKWWTWLRSMGGCRSALCKHAKSCMEMKLSESFWSSRLRSTEQISAFLNPHKVHWNPLQLSIPAWIWNDQCTQTRQVTYIRAKLTTSSLFHSIYNFCFLQACSARNLVMCRLFILIFFTCRPSHCFNSQKHVDIKCLFSSWQASKLRWQLGRQHV